MERIERNKITNDFIHMVIRDINVIVKKVKKLKVLMLITTHGLTSNKSAMLRIGYLMAKFQLLETSSHVVLVGLMPHLQL